MNYKIEDLRTGKVTDKDPELDKILDDLSECYNRLMIYMIKKDLGIEVKIIDDDHISVDGEVLDGDQFADWLDENYPPFDEDEWYDEKKPHYYDA